MHSPDGATPATPAPGRFPAAWVRWGILLVLIDLAKHALLFCAGLEQPWSDSVGYWRLGSDVASGDLALLRTAWGFRTPGYPWFLGGLIALFGHGGGFLAAILLQHAAVIATDCVVALWVARLTGSPRAAFLAGLAMTLATARPLYANWLLTESLATLCLTLAAYWLWSASGPRLRPLALAAVASGIGILIRPSLILLAPLVIAVSLIDSSSLPLGRRVARFAVPGFLLMAILLPWCGRNAHLFGRWTLLTFTGRELWTANFSPWPGANLPIPQEGPAADLRQRLAASPTIDLRHNASVAGGLGRSGLNDSDADRLMEQVAWQAIRRDPARSLLHDAARMGTFWYCKEYAAPPAPASDDSPFANLPQPHIPALARTAETLLRATPERTFLATWIWSGLTALATLACCWFPATRRAGWIIGFLLAGTTVLTAILEIPLYRYRLPLEPLTVVTLILAGWVVFRRESVQTPA